MRLTEILRHQIVKNVMADAFAKEKGEILKARHEVSERIRRCFIKPQDDILALQLSPELRVVKDHFHTQFKDENNRWIGFECELPVARLLPVKCANYGDIGTIEAPSREILAGCKKVDGLHSKLQEKIRLYREEVLEILNGVATVKRLLLAWPEIKKFLPESALVEPVKANLPAKLVSSVTAKLKKTGVDFSEKAA
jgi:hypothetical protein